MQWGVGPLIADRVELSRRGTFEAKTTAQRDVEHEMSGKARRNKERDCGKKSQGDKKEKRECDERTKPFGESAAGGDGVGEEARVDRRFDALNGGLGTATANHDQPPRST